MENNDMKTFRERVKDAAAEGCVLGVKLAVASAILWGVAQLTVADYASTRANAQGASSYLAAAIKSGVLPQDPRQVPSPAPTASPSPAAGK